MNCWYCHWGWSKQVRDIYDRGVALIGESGMEYGPAHIVWADENFELHNVEYCIEACDDKGAWWNENLSQADIEVVRAGLLELAALPKEVREPGDAYENVSDDRDDVENFPPPVGMVMATDCRTYTSDGTPGQIIRMYNEVH